MYSFRIVGQEVEGPRGLLRVTCTDSWWAGSWSPGLSLPVLWWFRHATDRALARDPITGADKANRR